MTKPRKPPTHPGVAAVHAGIAKHKSQIAHHEKEFARVNAEHEKDLKLHAKHGRAPMTGLKILELTAAQKFLAVQATARHGSVDQKKLDSAAKKLNSAWEAIRGKSYTSKDPVFKQRVAQMDTHRAGAYRSIAAVEKEYAKLWKL